MNIKIHNLKNVKLKYVDENGQHLTSILSLYFKRGQFLSLDFCCDNLFPKKSEHDTWTVPILKYAFEFCLLILA